MEALLQDLRHAVRTLLRSPGHAATVTATLAVGIAASTTVFSVMNPYLLRPLPYADADGLLQVEQVEPERGSRWVRFSLAQWTDWREGSRAFRDLAAYRYNNGNLTGEAPAERLTVSWTTANLFSVLGVRALHGRTYVEADGGPGAEPVVVLSHQLWSGRFGADPRLVGRTIRLDGVEHTVLGVMPPDFTFPWNEVRAWVPERAEAAWTDRARQSFILVGRLASGWTADRAESDLLRVQRELAELHSEVDGLYEGVNIRGLREALNFGYDVVRAGFALLLVAVGVLVLIACVNVAGLILARSTARTHEMAVRRALGASRGRMARHVLTESALLAAAGGTAGLVLAWLAVRAIGPHLPEDLFRVGTASLDGRVLAFSIGLTTLTPVLFGVSPALAASRTPPADALRSGARAGNRRGLGRRNTLVVTQVALAVVLAAITSLLGRSFLAVQRLDTGFQPARMVVAEATPSAADHPDEQAVRAFFARAVTALAREPGVVAVGQADRLPLNHETQRVAYRATEGEGAMETWPDAIYSRVDPGYFEATGTPILAGRGFTPADAAGSDAVVVVSRSLAEREWPGRSPVGRVVRIGTEDPAVEATVVGVAGDVRWTELTAPGGPHIYRPLDQSPVRRRFLVAMAGGAAATPLVQPVRAILTDLDPTVPVAVRPMTRVLRENDFQWAVSSAAVGGFSLLAVLLAALGIYGLMAYSVALRRRELGVRAALGAHAGSLRRMVVRQGLRLTGIGLLAGAALALMAGRLLRSLLFGVSPSDPLTFLLVTVLFLGVAVAASGGPAWRAARVPPAEALREE